MLEFVCEKSQKNPFLTNRRIRQKGIYMTNDNKKAIKVQQVKKIDLLPGDKVTYEYQGDRHTKVTYMKHRTIPHTKRLPGNKYINLRTKEVFDMRPKLAEKTGHHLRQTFEKLRGLIRTNFSNGLQNQVFLTLTYATLVRDVDRVMNDFIKFWMRLKYHMKGHNLEYINVLEPQASGRWHFHVMIKSDQPELWIDKWKIKDIWGHGNAYIERLKSDDVGAYYVAYFSHLYEEEHGEDSKCDTYENAMDQIESELSRHDPDEKRMSLLKKAKIKGARLKYYPKDTKFYRCSSGIIRPTRKNGDYIDTIDGSHGHMVHSSTQELRDDEGKLLNIIQKEYYKNNQKNGSEP